MANIVIEYPHRLPTATAEARLRDMGERLAADYGVTVKWLSPDMARVDGKGVDGSIVCSDGHVSVTLQLGFAASFIKGKIESGIRLQLSQALG